MEFQSQSIGHIHGHGHDAPQKVKEGLVWKAKMHGSDADGCRIVAFQVQVPILLAGNVSGTGGVAGPHQKDNPLLLTLHVFGSHHPKVKIGFQLFFVGERKTKTDVSWWRTKGITTKTKKNGQRFLVRCVFCICVLGIQEKSINNIPLLPNFFVGVAAL